MSQIGPVAVPANRDDGALSETRISLRILVADDDHDATLTLALLLKDEGHDVRMIHSGHTVMGAVIIFDPDVVILDIHMPGPSGWEAAKAIRERRGRGRPVLIGISGRYKSPAATRLSEIAGFDHYLLKPYDLRKLLALLTPLSLPEPRTSS
jgi:DNA-binding response OmpR family regulator